MAGAPLLRLSGLRVAYGSIPALRGVDLVVRAGEAVALLGANGAAKSTLIRAVMGFLRPAAGEIVFAGESLAGLPIERRAHDGRPARRAERGQSAGADRAYLLQVGAVVGEGPAATLATSDAVRRAFLGG